MPTRVLTRIFVILTLILTCAVVRAGGDAAREKLWADQLSANVHDAEIEWLQAGAQKFLALYSAQRSDHARGGVVLLHGLGGNPDWAEVIGPLRTQLPDYGWTTLAIQLPILGPDATLKANAALYDDAAPRITAGIAALRAKGVTRIALIGYGLGANMGAAYLAAKPDAGISGLVTIGLRVMPDEPLFNSPATLAKLKLPILDLYGSRDIAEVTDTAQARASAAHAADNNRYLQIAITGADSDFTGLSDTLVARVRGWLQRRLDKDESVSSGTEGTSKPAAADKAAAKPGKPAPPAAPAKPVAPNAPTKPAAPAKP